MYQHALVAAYQTDFYTGNHCRAGTQTLHYVGHRKINLGTKTYKCFWKETRCFFFTNADNFRKSGNITSVGSQFGGQGGSPSKFNC